MERVNEVKWEMLVGCGTVRVECWSLAQKKTLVQSPFGGFPSIGSNGMTTIQTFPL